MRGLIVHEWIERRGGAENVLDNIVSAFPDSDIYCLWNDDPHRYPNQLVLESWMAKTPFRKSKALALPFMPATWRTVRTTACDYQWIIASSHLFAHHVRLPLNSLRKFVYVHTPARYIWEPELDRRGAGLPARLVSSVLRRIDRYRAGDVGVSFAANSNFVRDRICRSWGVNSRVIYPPVKVTELQLAGNWSEKLTDTDRKIFDALPDGFLLGASRFVPYKRLDQVLRAGAHSGIPVVIAGSGPEEQNLRRLANELNSPAIFVIAPSDELLRALMEKCQAFIFPAVEDFGIIPVEAMALGTPSIVNSLGGAAESVIDGQTGCHVDDFDNLEVVAMAIARAKDLDPEIARTHARLFSSERFRSEITDWVSGFEDSVE